MSDIEKVLIEEIKSVIHKKANSQDSDLVLRSLKLNIYNIINEHNISTRGFSVLKKEIDIVLSVYYKIHIDDLSRIDSTIASIVNSLLANPKEVVYANLLKSRSKAVKSNVLKVQYYNKV